MLPVSAVAFCQVPAALIAKHKIDRIVITYSGQRPDIETNYYDSLGRVIRSVYNGNENHEKVITLYTYFNDTLVNTQKQLIYDKETLLATEITSYDYSFDEKGRMISFETADLYGRKKEVYSYNDRGLKDTVFYFNNDTIIYNGIPLSHRDTLPYLTLNE